MGSQREDVLKSAVYALKGGRKFKSACFIEDLKLILYNINKNNYMVIADYNDRKN
jgi:hypothetical protein